MACAGSHRVSESTVKLHVATVGSMTDGHYSKGERVQFRQSNYGNVRMSAIRREPA